MGLHEMHFMRFSGAWNDLCAIVIGFHDLSNLKLTMRVPPITNFKQGKIISYRLLMVMYLQRNMYTMIIESLHMFSDWQWSLVYLTLQYYWLRSVQIQEADMLDKYTKKNKSLSLENAL